MKDKCVLVTGAGSGNGRSIALAFGARGANVACIDRNGAGCDETVAMLAEAGCTASALQIDVTSDADCRRAAAHAEQRFGGIDVLVNNAGVMVGGGLLDLTEAQWDMQYAVNVKGPFLMTRAMAASLKARKGNIVMVASVAGLRGSAAHLAYSSSKHAVVGMTRCLALELGPLGVRVNAVCPGLVRTPMIDYLADSLAERAAAYPLRRIGDPADVARVVVHLASDEAAWTTGLCYTVDGGSALAAAR